MTKLTTSQYAIFMIAALTLLITVPSAYAATVNVNGTCQDDDNDGTCNDGTTFKNPSAAFTAAAQGDVIVVADGRYLDFDDPVKYITLNKHITLKSTNGDHAKDDVIFNGTGIRINADNVKVQGIKIVDARSHGIFVHPSKSNIVVENNYINNTIYAGIEIAGGSSHIIIDKNTFNNTGRDGIYVKDVAPTQNLTVTDNVFNGIGTFYQPTLSDKQKEAKLYSAMTFVNVESSQVGLHHSKITGNTIDTTTFGGINLRDAEGVLVLNNTISNVPGPAIKVKSTDQIRILDNHIHNANNVLVNGIQEDIDNGIITEGAIVLWGETNSNVVVNNNTIAGGNNGIVYCTGVCGLRHQPSGDYYYADATTDKATKTDNTNLFTHNTFDNVNGFYLMNMAVGTMIAPLNYYGSPASPLVQNATHPPIYGNVIFGPWYIDASLTQIAERSGSKQTQTGAYNTCSIDLDKSSLDLPPSQYGKTSGIATQGVTNAGSAELSAIEVRVSDWTDNTGSTVPDVHSEVKSSGENSWNVVKPGSSVEITDNLPQPRDGNSKLSLDYRVDMTGNSNGPSGPIKQTVTYIADCS